MASLLTGRRRWLVAGALGAALIAVAPVTLGHQRFRQRRRALVGRHR
jgi:hypothetical protein